MSGEMVERVARLLEPFVWDDDHAPSDEAGERWRAFQREELKHAARAIIAALREPTDAMRDRATILDPEGEAIVTIGIWQALIDEALK